MVLMLSLSELMSLLPFLFSVDFALSFSVCYGKSLAHTLVSCPEMSICRAELLVELRWQRWPLCGPRFAASWHRA